jgi:ribonuclease E
VALHVLRQLEDQLLKGVTHNLTIRTRTVVALYILNQKRSHLAELEQRFGLTITVAADETITNGAHFVIERGEPVEARERPAAMITPASVEPDVADAPTEDGEAAIEEIEETYPEEAEAEHGHDERDHGGEREGGRRRRRRRGRGRGGDRFEGGGQPRQQGEFRQDQPREQHAEGDEMSAGGDDEPRHENGEAFQGQLGPDGLPRKRRRGRRGGRRGRRGRGGNGEGRQFDQDRQGGGEFQGGQQDNRPRTEQPRPFGSSYDDEIDTTPTMETRASFEAPRRLDSPESDILPDEVDTTPQPIERAAAVRNEETASASPPQPAPEPEAEVEDPNRPKRSGWWQRKSFF